MDTRRVRTVPASFRCNQSMMGLLDLRFTFLGVALLGGLVQGALLLGRRWLELRFCEVCVD